MNSETFTGSARQRLKQARALVEAGAFDEAHELILSLQSDPGVTGSESRDSVSDLGSRTMLDLPRKLHSLKLRLAKAQGNRLERIGLQYTLVPPPELLGPLTRFTSTERQAMTLRNREPVPRILHQIWLGPLPVPPATERWREHAARHGLEYRLWREADLDQLRARDHPVFAHMLAVDDYPGAVDVARYAILAEIGGIYLDCDWYPARDDLSFADLLPLIGLAALAEDTPRDTGLGSLLLTNSLIAAPPRHPVFERLLAILPEVIELLPEGPAWWSTGPLVMTLLFRGTTFTVPDAAIVASTLARRAPFTEVEAVRGNAIARDLGLLIGWKSW